MTNIEKIKSIYLFLVRSIPLDSEGDDNINKLLDYCWEVEQDLQVLNTLKNSFTFKINDIGCISSLEIWQKEGEHKDYVDILIKKDYDILKNWVERKEQ